LFFRAGSAIVDGAFLCLRILYFENIFFSLPALGTPGLSLRGRRDGGGFFARG
jgi:hypothetical protein